MSKTCQNCGNIFEDTANVCPRCGMQYIEAPNETVYNNPYQSYQQPQQQTYYNQSYQQPYYQQGYVPAQTNDRMTLGSWVGTVVLTHMFGLISIILLFVWGFSDSTPPAKKTYCRAMLIYYAIMIGVAILVFILFLSFGFALSDWNTYYY